MRIDTKSQVRNLIAGIKITQFGEVKDKIMATTYLRTDYDGCVSLYKILIDNSKKVSPPELDVSGVESCNHKGGGQKKRKGRSGGAVEYFLLFLEEVAVPGASGADFMTSTSAYTCFTNSYVVPLLLDLTFLSAGLFPLAFLLL